MDLDTTPPQQGTNDIQNKQSNQGQPNSGDNYEDNNVQENQKGYLPHASVPGGESGYIPASTETIQNIDTAVETIAPEKIPTPEKQEMGEKAKATEQPKQQPENKTSNKLEKSVTATDLNLQDKTDYPTQLHATKPADKLTARADKEEEEFIEEVETVHGHGNN